MNSDTRCWRLIFALVTIATLLGFSGREALADSSQNPYIVLPDQAASMTGQNYGEWSGLWWKWMLGIPFGQNLPNPTFYSDGTHCNTNQSGTVWFLTEPASGGMATEQCTVPYGQYIFIPILNAECSTYELPLGVYPSSRFGPGCNDEAECSACAKTLADLINTGSVNASVDGIPVTGLQSSSSPFRTQSPFFQFSVPTNNFFATEGLSGAGSGMSVSDGYWLMVRPLIPGQHSIHVEAAFTRFKFGENVTYKITVSQP
ncbi:hypothetical protein GCT13_39930 [Paraburkholderia sp. CNPSo 3157]|uniref:Uncharacterized protein n=1 Tax=Paraburkholderia franconis TaxID=2654983 RepID=A0A7X1NIZ8_9BURK|nr:hypothetical protein [Paraburkholderia franconis]MPW22809.1 hypothetical protein [Paraburkholderia franconis]